MPRPVTRRTFLGRAAGTGLALGLTHTAAPAAAAPAPSAPAGPVVKPLSDWPRWDHQDETALLDVLHSGKWGRTAGGPSRVKEFETAWAARLQARHCIATSSGTTALLTALGALNVGPGDEGAPCTGQDRPVEPVVGGEVRHRGHEARAHGVGQRVDRRAVDGDDGDAAVPREGDDA